MNVDLHCHSSHSDGVLHAADLVRRAAGNGVELLALTDHDEMAGLAAARMEARRCAVRFVSGVEISVTWHETTIHVVGLALDSTNAPLAAGLAGIRAGRIERARAIADALTRIGFEGALEGASRHAGEGGLIGRTHFARFLVERKAAADVRGVFERYLVRGRPGYVAHEWAGLEQALSWIRAAGGLAVLAHPARYRIGTRARGRLLGEFKDCGGAAIEVVSGSHAPGSDRTFARLARRFGFLGSCGSDFHAPGESSCDVGRAGALPEGIAPIWEAFA
ncbi:MAG: PHP domain-containing protein [Rhodocyclaceae bacterium]